MMANWYTADLHFGHENILSHAARPFRDVQHMDAALLENLWNKVAPEDQLWIIGDFAFGPKAKDEAWLWQIFGQLPGAGKHLIIGNHDGPLTRDLPWTSVSHLAEVNDPASDLPVTLCHYPMMTWDGARKGAVHLFGHVHGNWRGSANSVNAGVDVWEFSSIRLQDALSRMKSLPPHKHWQDVEPRVRR
ncbi:metallophosphoesterase [Falsigemmobacter intermedius]|nr:metallophosphoesterase [Falsigemmobacter intermedius]